jgi:hypothetical protein
MASASTAESFALIVGTRAVRNAYVGGLTPKQEEKKEKRNQINNIE